MRKIFVIIFVAAAVAASCAKTSGDTTSEKEVLAFNSWVEYNKGLHPEYLWKETELGCYILEDSVGTGYNLGDSSYVCFDYSTRSLTGAILSTTSEQELRQLGTYCEQAYIGPVVYQRVDSALYVGLEEAMKGMKMGGKRKVLIPGWLLANTRYGSVEEYQRNNTGKTTIIYDIELREAFSNLYEWQLKYMKEYVAEYYPGADTLTAGIYFKRLKEPTSEEEIPSDSTVYINYSGRLLNRHLFDTNIKRLAQDSYPEDFDASGSYTPCSVTWAEEYSDIKMSSSSVVEGFARTLKNMHPGEKAVGIFWSGMGYGATGSSNSDDLYTIPPFAPLAFEIELVDKPE